MHSTDVQIVICGSAGDGTIATGDILKRAMARAGYKVISFDIYPAEIRGFATDANEVQSGIRGRSELLWSAQAGDEEGSDVGFACDLLGRLDHGEVVARHLRVESRLRRAQS